MSHPEPQQPSTSADAQQARADVGSRPIGPVLSTAAVDAISEAPPPNPNRHLASRLLHLGKSALRQPWLLTLVVLSVGAWGFINLAELVEAGTTLTLDEQLIRALRQPDDPRRLIGPAWLADVARDFTALGGMPLLATITTIVCLYLRLAGRAELSLFAAAATVSGGVMTYVLKGVFDRSRPVLVEHIYTAVSSGSFPSGHAMGSALVYLTLGAIIMEFVERWPLKVYVMTVAILLTLVIGATRVFLGVHYPTDVLAGWAAGLMWAYFCRALIRFGRHLHGRGTTARSSVNDHH